MLAQTEMFVVIVLNEPISLGTIYGDGEEKDVKGLIILKVPQ